jgi:P4 family phage/plasmid primase-like protien
MIMYGPSNTGKSQALGAMVVMVGKKNHTSIGVHEMDDPRKLAPIKGKMLNQIGELSEDVLISDSGFKRLVSVGEPVRIDPKWGHVEDYLPSCKHVICTNNLPQVRDYTMATFNRMAMLKFNRVIEDHLQDKFLLEKLTAEMAGIMVWAIRGAEKLFRKKGEFTSVEESEIEIKQYRSEQNAIVAFLDDMTIPTLPGTYLVMEDFRKKYRDWDPVTRFGDTKITHMLKKAGCVVKNRSVDGRTRKVLEERSWAK